MATVYISSTYSDLKECREHVYRALRQLGHDVRAMEDYVAADMRPVKRCLDDIGRCDIYVGIFAWRYGFIPDEDNPEGKSITELEFRHASERLIPTLVFLLNLEAPWPRSAMDAGDGAARIEALRAELMKRTTVSFFDSAENLALLVNAAVTNQLAKIEAAHPSKRFYESIAPRTVNSETLVAAGTQLLATLPPGQLHAPAPLPPGSRIALRPNPLFVGRDDELRKLGEAVSSGQMTAVTGLPGVGKTQLASEFVHRYGKYFIGGVFWLNFTEEHAVLGEIAACGGVGHLDLRRDFAGLPLADQVRAVVAAWQSPLPRLLIFDSCEDPKLLDLGPKTGGCRVLLTSRNPDWAATFGMVSISIGVLECNQSVTLLRRYLEDDAAEASDLKPIAEELGNLPLALHLAGSVLARYREAISPAAYLEWLRRSPLLTDALLPDPQPSPTGHRQPVAATFALCYAQLNAADAIDGLAIVLWTRASQLAPGEPIPRDLLLASADLRQDRPEEVRRGEDAVTRLLTLGLLERETAGTLRLHRLLAAFARQQVTDASAQAAVERAALQKASEHIRDSSLTSMLALQPHLRHLTDRAIERADEQAAELATTLADLFMRLGNYRDAPEYYDRALAIIEAIHGERDRLTLAAMQRAGWAHMEGGDKTSAQQHFERALEISKAVYGTKHPDIAVSLTNLGFIFKDRSKYGEARRCFQRALTVIRALKGDHHPDTAVALNNLGLVYKDQKRYAGAERYFKRALKISQAAIGDDRRGIVSSLNNLAFVLKDQAGSKGTLRRAQAYFERALEINVATHGEQNMETIASLSHLAFVLVDQALEDATLDQSHRTRADELFAEARHYLERALTIEEQMFPERHPRTATALDSLGELLSRQGDAEGARQYFERALAIRQQVLGEWHLDTARSLGKLGRQLALQVDNGQSDHLSQAKSYLEQSLAAFERSLGQQEIRRRHRDSPADSPPDIARVVEMLEAVDARLQARGDKVLP